MDQLDNSMSAFQALPHDEKMRRMQVLDDDTRDAFVQQYNQWKSTKKAAPVPPKTDQSAPGFYQGQPTDVASGASQQFSRRQAQNQAETPFRRAINSPGARAFIGGALPMAGYIGDVVGSGGQYLRQRFADGPQAALPQLGSGVQQDRQRRAIDDNTLATIAGGVTGGLLTGGPSAAFQGAGKIASGVARGAQGFLYGSSSAAAQGQDPSQGGALGAAGAAFLPPALQQLGKVPGAVQRLLVTKLAPPAMNMIRSMAQSILTAKGVPQSYGQLLKTESKLGLGSRWDDLLYFVVNKIKPQIFEPIAQRNARAAQITSLAGQAVGQIKAPMKQTLVPAQAVSRDLQSVARRLQTDMSQAGSVGPQAAQIVRNQYMPTVRNVVQAQQPSVVSYGQFGGRTPTPQPVTAKLAQQINADDPSYGYIMPPPASGKGKLGKFETDPTTGDLNPKSNVVPRTEPKWTNEQIAQAPQYRQQIPSQLQLAGVIKRGQPAKIPLGQLQRRRVQLQGSNYKPTGTQISTPQAALTRANQAIQQYTLNKAGYSDLARSRLAQAGDQYHIANKTLDILSQHGQPGQGMTANTPWGQALGFVGQTIKQRGAPMILKPAQAVANRAINIVQRLTAKNSQFGVQDVIPSDTASKIPFMSPTQKQAIVSKMQAIARMAPQDASVFAFAESMSSPAFRQIWMMAQQEQE